MKLSHIAVLGPIFYISKIIGLLPVCYNFDLFSKNCGKSPSKDKPFSISKFGLVLSITQLVTQLITGYFILEFCARTAIEYKVTCMRGNHCAIYGIFISHALVSVLTLISALISCRNTVKCLNTVFYLLKEPNPCYRRLPLAAYSIVGFMALHALRLVLSKIHSSLVYPFFYQGYYVSYFIPIVSQNLVATLALAAENLYKQVNHDLDGLFHEVYERRYYKRRIQKLAELHSNITDFVEEISSSFGLDILLGMIDCFLQLVLFLYLTIWNVFVEGLFTNGFIPYMSGVIEIITIVIKIVYLCYQCHKTTKNGNMTLWHLHRLTTRRDISPQCHQQINTFVMQHNSRPIKITALGLFSLDMDLLLKIIGTVSTYFIVLIQFQINGGKKAFTPNTHKKTIDCNIWPCLTG